MGSIITLSIVQSALELGFIYALVALALFVSFSILDIADLSTDGCFTLGCAVCATVTLAGHPVLGLFAAAAAGVVSGFVTAFLQTRMGIQSILAGIIVNTGLYTINIAVMGFASNINLFSCDTVFSWAKDHIGGTWYKLIVAAVFVVIVGVILAWFLNTRLGLSIRATGDNPDMVRASSINTATADMAADILVNGADPAATAVRTLDSGIVTVNTETAAAVGIDDSVFKDMCEELKEVTTAEEFE